MKPIRFTRGSRKHRVGKLHAHHVIADSPATVTTDPETGQVTLSWIGEDQRGRELEIVALERDDCFLVVHVMPTALRKSKKES